MIQKDMTSTLDLELLSPDLIVARISEKNIKDEFPWEIPIGSRIPADVELLECLVAMFEIDLPQFYFNHRWSKDFEIPRGDLEALVVDGKIYREQPKKKLHNSFYITGQ